MSLTCPGGHPSADDDYCSVCGLAIAAAPAPAPAPLAPAAGAKGHARGATCPLCSEPRADVEARFCEVCRYDFEAGAGGGVAVPAAPARWRVVVIVDPSLDVEPDASMPCPHDTPAARVDVVAAELLLGRRDDRRDIRPELPLSDPGASRRHAKLLRDGAGLTLHDLASTNGTKLNGVDVASGSRTALRAGDEITLGRWTRIRVETF